MGGEIVLLELNAGRYYRLNDVAGRIWRALDERPEVAGALETLQRTFASTVSAETLEGDLDAFLEALLAAGLLARA